MQDTATTSAPSLSIFAIMSALSREHNAINLGQGFPNFDCSPDLKALVQKHMNAGKNQYAPMPGVKSLRDALSNKVHSLYGTKLDSESQITITAGATQAIFTTIAAFINQGDEVIIIEPAYDSYLPSISSQGGITISYELKAPDFKIDWDAFKKLITERTKMIIINTPHNPTGSTLKSNDLEALQELIKGKDIVLLSDEVYEHLIFDNEEHQSVLRYPELFNQSICVYSFGKTFHNTGWKMGYAIAPDHIMQRFRLIHQWNVFSVNSFVQFGLAEYLEDATNYTTLPEFYQKKRDHFVQAIEGSRFKIIPSSGTYFQLVDYSALSDLIDVDYAKHLVIEHGIASIPISPFYRELKHQKLLRFCFAKTPDILDRAAEVLCRI